MSSEILSRVTRIPNIVFYLLFTIILGPLGLRFLHPGILIPNLELLDFVIKMALALIIFEGWYSFNRCFITTIDQRSRKRVKDCKPLPLRHLIPQILMLVLIAGSIPPDFTIQDNKDGTIICTILKIVTRFRKKGSKWR